MDSLEVAIRCGTRAGKPPLCACVLADAEGRARDLSSEMAATRRNPGASRATREYECPSMGGRQRRGGELLMVIVITKVEDIEAVSYTQSDAADE
jgi:hypothetical protein